MSPRDYELTRELIIHHEGFRAHPTPDAHGTLTIGYGRNLMTQGLSELAAGWLLQEDLERLLVEVPAAWPPFDTCDGLRQRVLLEMAYQLGVGGLLGFRRMLHALATGDHATAAAEVRASALARQTPDRARDYAQMLEEPPHTPAELGEES